MISSDYSKQPIEETQRLLAVNYVTSVGGLSEARRLLAEWEQYRFIQSPVPRANRFASIAMVLIGLLLVVLFYAQIFFHYGVGYPDWEPIPFSEARGNPNSMLEDNYGMGGKGVADTPEELFDRGNEAMEGGDIKLAITYFEQAARLKPDSEEYLVALAQAHLKLGDSATALNILANTGSDADAHFALAKKFIELKDFDKATEQLRNILGDQLKDKVTDTIFNLSKSLLDSIEEEKSRAQPPTIR